LIVPWTVALYSSVINVFLATQTWINVYWPVYKAVCNEKYSGRSFLECAFTNCTKKTLEQDFSCTIVRAVWKVCLVVLSNRLRCM
jgi:hypothetical protein